MKRLTELSHGERYPAAPRSDELLAGVQAPELAEAGTERTTLGRFASSSRSGALSASSQSVDASRASGRPGNKRRSIELLIGTFPKVSDRKIGEACGVDNKTVAATRARLTKPTEEIPHPETEQAAAPPEPIDPDTAIVSKLLKQAERLIAQCPESKRIELWAHITNIFESKTEPKISESA